MKLFYTSTSPYARKVRVAAIEKGLGHRIELQPCNLQAPDAAFLAANPLGRVPTLVLDEGDSLLDSPVICEWLDAQSELPLLIPSAGPERWAVLRGQALADGMMDDAVAVMLERRREETHQSTALLDRGTAALLRSVDLLESRPPAASGPVDLAQIAIGCALGYLDLRLPDLDWRRGHGALAGWYAAFAQRPSMQETRPELPPA